METNPTNKRKKRLLIGLGLLTTGVLSCFGYQYWKGNKKQSDKPETNSPDFNVEKPKEKPKQQPKPKQKQSQTKKPPVKKPAPKTPVSTNVPMATFPDYFPLKKGSQGERVKQLQQALISKYGSSVLPKGATGIYDTDLQNALVKLKLPASIDETTFNVLVQKKIIDPAMIAKALFLAIKAKSFSAVVKILKAIKKPTDYSAVNKLFQSYFIIGKKTIVNAVLDTFTTEAQKQEIRLAFAAMGLKYDGKKWSLDGLDGVPTIITLQKTKVWKDPRTWVEVPPNMVLGKEIAKRKEFSLFENDKQYFLVKSSDVGIFKN